MKLTRKDIIKNVLTSEKLQQGVKITIYQHQLLALCTLKPAAAEVLNRMIKLTPRSVEDPVDYFVEYTYKDFEFLPKRSFYRSRDELVKAGFIKLDDTAFYVCHDMVNHTSFKQYQLLMKHFAVGPNYANNVPDFNSQ